MKLIKHCSAKIERITQLIPSWLPVLVARLAVFSVFWRSVQTKISGLTIFDQHLAFWNVGSNAKMLFNYEYNLPLISGNLAAYLGTYSEFFFALMLLFGFLTRFSAVGLLGVTAVIQIFVYPSAWPTHIMWVGLLLVILREGGGKISLDYVIAREKS